MINLNQKYNLLGADSRYFVITGGRGSGKSYSLNSFLLLLTYEVGHVILFTRYTLTSAHVSIIPEFIDKIETADLSHDFYITKDEIVNLKTGSKILFKGIKTSSGTQTANLKSLAGVTTWVLDEAEELNDEDTFDKIDFSIRAKGIQNRVILVLNPATKEHFIYKRFFESKGIADGSNLIHKDTTYIHTTYLDNYENLSESFILQLEDMKTRRKQKYNHQIMGAWLEKAEGVVFTNWQFGVFNPHNLPTSFGLDFGFSIDPDTLIEVAIDKDHKKIYVKEHLYQNGLRMEELAKICTDKATNKLIIADSAENRLIVDLRHKGLNIEPIKKVNFEYEKSESFLNRAYYDNASKEYGNLNYQFNNDGSDYTIKLPFENLTFNKFTGTNLQVGFSLNKEFKPYIPKPIILYQYENAACSFYFNNNVSTNHITNYNVFGQDVKYQTNIHTLNWGIEYSSYNLQTINNTLFKDYYFDYLNNLYSLKSRMVKVSMRLPYSELLALRLNDRIVIRDKRYIINSFTTDLDTYESKFELIQDFRTLNFNNSLIFEIDNLARPFKINTVGRVALTWSILNDPTGQIISITNADTYVELDLKSNTSGAEKIYSVQSNLGDIIVIRQAR